MYCHGPSELKGPRRRATDWSGARPNGPAEVGRADERVRHDLVARVRRELEAGTYETPEKLEIALERLLDRLGGD